MNLINRSRSLLVLLITAILIFSSAIPVSAEGTSKSIEIRVKVGSTQMKINGEAVKIQAPFLSAGNAMVPLSVFTNTKGFGAKLQLKNNKIITLTYQKHTIVLTLGSKAATIDGKMATLAVAPLNKAGVTMIPIAIVAKSFGATQSNDDATKEIVIKATLVTSTANSGGAGILIDTDAGKSKIGDSYFSWSMNYPTGLVKTEQSPDGDKLIFQDVKKEYFLGVFAEEAKDMLTPDEKWQNMYRYYGETEKTVDKQSVETSDKKYERIITKDKEGFFFEYRGIQANGFFYVIVFGKKATTAAELDKYASQLNSFATTFNKNDNTLKDLTQIIEGFKTFSDADYGLSVKLPKEWKTDDKSSYPYYYTDNAYLYLDVTSLVAGDTLDAWVKRKQQRFEDVFATPYHKVLETKDIIWNGLPAKQLKLSYSYDTESWWEEYEIFAIKGQYRYYTEVAYTENQKSDYSNLLDIVLRSTIVDSSAVEKNFGQITDDFDNSDRTAKVTKTSLKYGYSVTLPQYWTGETKNFEEDRIFYTYGGGEFAIEVWDTNSANLQEFNSSVDQNIQNILSQNPKLKLVENSSVSLAGTPAKKVVLDNMTNDDKHTPNRGIYYYIWKNGKIYYVYADYYLANGSDFILKNIDETLKSLTFTS
jgi:hypothetical protein